MGPKALALLGLKFWIHVFKRATFLYRRGGSARFRGDFDPEGLLPMAEDDRDLLHTWQRCIQCGLCDAVCPEDILGVIPQGQGFALGIGPHFVASAVVRDPSVYGQVWSLAEPVAACEGCTQCQDACPVDVPLKDLAGFVVRTGQAAAQAKADAA